MRLLLRLALAFSLFSAAGIASAQTFTVDQPKNSANPKSATRPNTVSVAPDTKTSKKPHSAASAKIEETTPAPGAAATAKHHTTKHAVKATKKSAPAPAPVADAPSTPPP